MPDIEHGYGSARVAAMAIDASGLLAEIERLRADAERALQEVIDRACTWTDADRLRVALQEIAALNGLTVSADSERRED